MGNPSHKPSDETRSLVKGFSAFGVPQSDIAKYLKLDPKTLRKHYPSEIEFGMMEANAKVAKSLYDQAVSGNTAASIFWLKARCGWTERTELVGAGGGPLTVTVVYRDA